MNTTDHDMIAKLVETIERNARQAAAKAAATSHPIPWVKLDRYVEVSGDSVESVMARRRAGKWIDGCQCKIVDGRLWVNLLAVEEWVEKWDQKNPYLAALSSGRESTPSRSA